MAYTIKDPKQENKRQVNGEPVVGSLFNNWQLDTKSFKTDPVTGERSFKAVASTSTRDRDGDIILTEGFTWAKKPDGSPAVAGPFGHNYYQVPIYKVTDIVVTSNKLSFTPVFPAKGKSTLADEVYDAFEDERMFGFSVGFKALKSQPLTIGLLRERGLLEAYSDNPSDYSLPDDTTLRGFLFEKQELLEISAVPVPANAEALSTMRSLGISEVEETEGLFIPKGMFVKDDKGKVFNPASINYDEFVEDSTEEVMVGKHYGGSVVDFCNYPMVEYSAISFNKDLKKPKRINTKDLFLLAKEMEGDIPILLGLHHALNEEGEVVTVKDWVIETADLFFGEGSSLVCTEEELANAKDHLEMHFEQFDEVPPWVEEDDPEDAKNKNTDDNNKEMVDIFDLINRIDLISNKLDKLDKLFEIKNEKTIDNIKNDDKNNKKEEIFDFNDIDLAKAIKSACDNIGKDIVGSVKEQQKIINESFVDAIDAAFGELKE